MSKHEELPFKTAMILNNNEKISFSTQNKLIRSVHCSSQTHSKGPSVCQPLSPELPVSPKCILITGNKFLSVKYPSSKVVTSSSFASQLHFLFLLHVPENLFLLSNQLEYVVLLNLVICEMKKFKLTYSIKIDIQFLWKFLYLVK